jgi:hypothetical protein
MPQAAAPYCGLHVVAHGRNFQEVGLHQYRSEKKVKSAGSQPARPLSHVPGRRRPPPNCRAFRRQSRGSLLRQTRRWREVDSNPRSPVRKLAPDVGTPWIIDGMRPRKSGSQRTRRWREMDSNPRSPVRGTTFFETPGSTTLAIPLPRERPAPLRKGPTVRNPSLQASLPQQRVSRLQARWPQPFLRLGPCRDPVIDRFQNMKVAVMRVDPAKLEQRRALLPR